MTLYRRQESRPRPRNTDGKARAGGRGQCRRASGERWLLGGRGGGFDPWVRKIPWRRAWQPTLVFLPGESHGQRSLMGYSPWGHRVRHDLVAK